MDLSSSKRVAAVRHARKGTRLMAERINKEGWRLLNVANKSLQFDIITTSPGDTPFRAGGTFLLLQIYFPPSFHASLSLLCWRIFYNRILMPSATTLAEEG